MKGQRITEVIRNQTLGTIKFSMSNIHAVLVFQTSLYQPFALQLLKIRQLDTPSSHTACQSLRVIFFRFFHFRSEEVKLSSISQKTKMSWRKKKLADIQEIHKLACKALI